MSKKLPPIILASDHGGYELKETIKKYLLDHDVTVEDIGTNTTDPIDFPDIVKRAVTRVLHHGTRAIFICGTGIGVSIAANRYKRIRAALCHTEIYAQLARQHNDANVLCLGGRFIDADTALNITKIFLTTEFLGDKYLRRMQLVEKMG
ncbi:MAG: ribose 5-phosphate isomerase B [Firmicutes bacterium]|nr:ribose 5-phosphate isomerase B [Bacillota bacterium]